MKAKKTMILGLTGGIGTGKTTVAKLLAGYGYPIYSADDAVHKLLGKRGKAIAPIRKLFPTSVENGLVNRQILGKLVFGKPKQLKTLENILHPLVHQEEQKFLKSALKKKSKAVVLEIPLLFETGADKRCDKVLITVASKRLQKKRVLQRKGMNEAKFKAILKHQMTDRQRKKHADFIINTDKGLEDTSWQIQIILKKLCLIK